MRTPAFVSNFADSVTSRAPSHAPYRGGTLLSVLVDVVRVLDFCVLLAGGLLAAFLVQSLRGDALQPGYLLCAIMASYSAVICLNRQRAYAIPRLWSTSVQIRCLATSLAVGATVLCASTAVLEFGTRSSLLMRLGALGAAWLLITTLLTTALRITVLQVLMRQRRNGHFGHRTALLGSAKSAAAFIAHLPSGWVDMLQIVGLYKDEEDAEGLEITDLRYCGTIHELIADGQRGKVDTVVVALPASEAHRMDRVSSLVGTLATDLYLYVAPDRAPAGAPAADFAGVPVAVLSRRPLSEWQLVQKALFDLFGSAVLLVVVAPLLLLLALIIKLDSDGPVLFRQTRIGFNNIPFTCYKFRTMYLHAEDALADRQTTRNDSRVTRAGRWLRRTSLDELPQLLNVLRGEMSLVGPRPHAPNTRADGRLFSDAVGGYAMRHRVKPGITGWAQVNGWRGETATIEQIEQRVRHDLYYIHNWSLLLDVRIMLMTALYGFSSPQAY